MFGERPENALAGVDAAADAALAGVENSIKDLATSEAGPSAGNTNGSEGDALHTLESTLTVKHTPGDGSPSTVHTRHTKTTVTQGDHPPSGAEGGEEEEEEKDGPTAPVTLAAAELRQQLHDKADEEAAKGAELRRRRRNKNKGNEGGGEDEDKVAAAAGTGTSAGAEAKSKRKSGRKASSKQPSLAPASAKGSKQEAKEAEAEAALVQVAATASDQRSTVAVVRSASMREQAGAIVSGLQGTTKEKEGAPGAGSKDGPGAVNHGAGNSPDASSSSSSSP